MNVEVITVALPKGVNGLVMADFTPGAYTVLINDALTKEERDEALRHELTHIGRGDLLKEGADVRQLEAENRQDFRKKRQKPIETAKNSEYNIYYKSAESLINKGFAELLTKRFNVH